MKQQFQLSYFGKVSYEASQDMPIHEREFMFGLLLDQKKSEQEAAEKARKEAQSHSSSPKKPRKRRHR